MIVEDHHPEGGLGEAVLAALAGRSGTGPVAHLAVRHLPDSRTPAEQLAAAGISAGDIVRTVQRLLGDLPPEPVAR